MRAMRTRRDAQMARDRPMMNMFAASRLMPRCRATPFILMPARRKRYARRAAQRVAVQT